MITILCGKSASGKDTLLTELKNSDGFCTIISTTSRPIREGEQNGREYNFVPKSEFLQMIEKDEFLEYRTYNTTFAGEPDTWYYGCPKKTLDDLDPNKDYVIILDMGGTKDFINYYGKENCFVCYVDTSDDIRVQRASQRGSFDETEWNRRAADDNIKFSNVIVDDLANARLFNNEGTLKDLKESFMRALKNYKENKDYYRAEVDWNIDSDECFEYIENVVIPEKTVTEATEEREECIAKASISSSPDRDRIEKILKEEMHTTIEEYHGMNEESRKDLIDDAIRHRPVLAEQIINTPSSVIIPEIIATEAMEKGDGWITDYLSDYYGSYVDGFTCSDKLEVELCAKEME